MLCLDAVIASPLLYCFILFFLYSYIFSLSPFHESRTCLSFSDLGVLNIKALAFFFISFSIKHSELWLNLLACLLWGRPFVNNPSPYRIVEFNLFGDDLLMLLKLMSNISCFSVVMAFCPFFMAWCRLTRSATNSQKFSFYRAFSWPFH